MRILHAFADDGVESEALSDYGEVVQVGLDPTDKNASTPIKADATDLPFAENSFDLGLFHPPCGFVSPLSDTKGGSREDWPNLIPDARREAKRVCDHYIIENKKEARSEMRDPIVLDGGMFGLPIDYKRAFETSFTVEQPPQQRTFGETETSPFFSSERSKLWWATAKGYTTAYQKGHLAKNCVPRPYLQYLMQAYAQAIDKGQRADYSEYDKEMDTRRAKKANTTLGKFQ